MLEELNARLQQIKKQYLADNKEATPILTDINQLIEDIEITYAPLKEKSRAYLVSDAEQLEATKVLSLELKISEFIVLMCKKEGITDE